MYLFSFFGDGNLKYRHLWTRLAKYKRMFAEKNFAIFLKRFVSLESANAEFRYYLCQGLDIPVLDLYAMWIFEQES